LQGEEENLHMEYQQWNGMECERQSQRDGVMTIETNLYGKHLMTEKHRKDQKVLMKSGCNPFLPCLISSPVLVLNRSPVFLSSVHPSFLCVHSGWVDFLLSFACLYFYLSLACSIPAQLPLPLGFSFLFLLLFMSGYEGWMSARAHVIEFSRGMKCRSEARNFNRIVLIRPNGSDSESGMEARMKLRINHRVTDIATSLKLEWTPVLPCILLE